MTSDRKNPLSAGVVVVRRINGEWCYLLLRAYQYWDFPKGLVEQGEEPLAAAQREVTEETTLNTLQFHWGEKFRETPPYGLHKKIARYYLAESPHGDVSLPVSPELGRPEHEEFRWVTQAQAETMLAPRVQPVLQWAVTLLAGA
jgi:bis(5'-nucleosidyl)-tetraphosphatase